jgi:stearoyl-CoA desaturase (delta-9 desaturase)
MGFNITGGQAFVWGFLISTIVLFHATVSINSLAHLFGKKRYATKDNSKNNVWLAILTLGEGWHNNHHHYPNSARQGFFWWEIDVTYYILKLLSFVRIVSDIKPTPLSIKNKNRVG